MSSLAVELPRQQASETDAATTWKPLRLLNAYRFILAALFLMLAVGDYPPELLPRPHPQLFLAISSFYLGFALLSAFTLYTRQPAFSGQVYIQTGTDIAVLTLLLYAAGGISSGLGMLLIITVAGVSVLVTRRIAVLFAAVATLAVLGEEMYGHFNRPQTIQAFTQAGILGGTFFVTALTVQWLAYRLRETEELAERRSLDLANMAQLNDYIIQHMEAGVIVVDGEEHVRLINEAAWYLAGMPAGDPHRSLGNTSPELAEALRAWREDPEQAPRSIRPSRSAGDVLIRFQPLGSGPEAGALIFLEDASLASQQMQQMKLASLGRLTASIAHEIRNPLGAISHAAQLLGESSSSDSNGEARLTQIIREHADRMNEIIENVLQLSRRRDSHPQLIQLQSWLNEFVEEFCQGESCDPEQMVVDVESPDLRVRIDPSHLHQVMWNLCQNALFHGNSQSKSPTVHIRATRMMESRGPILEVVDSGPGIDPEVADQIFEPFFTTSGQGTGLGLYLARELCECNRARLEHVPVPSGGTCFRITFAEPIAPRVM